MRTNSSWANWKTYAVILLFMWWPVLWAYLEKNPNIFTVLVIDRWTFILPALSFIFIGMYISIKYRWRVVQFLLVGISFLLLLAIITSISVWLVISIENNTSMPLTAFSVDLSLDKIRTAVISPKEKKLIVLTRTGDLDKAKNHGYHIFVYDRDKNIYFNETLNAEQLTERFNKITIGKNGELIINNTVKGGLCPPSGDAGIPKMVGMAHPTGLQKPSRASGRIGV